MQDIGEGWGIRYPDVELLAWAPLRGSKEKYLEAGGL